MDAEVGKMSNVDRTDDVKIQFEFGNRFRRQVEKGDTDPLIGMFILIGDDFVFGNSELHLPSRSYMTTTLLELLEAIDSMESGRSQVIEFANGPTHLVFEPHDNFVTITGCLTRDCVDDPENRTEAEVSRTVLIEKWTDELIRAAEEFYEQVLNTNPSENVAAELSPLRRAIERTVENH